MIPRRRRTGIPREEESQLSLSDYIAEQVERIRPEDELEAKLSIGKFSDFNILLNPTILDLSEGVSENNKIHQFPPDNIMEHEEIDYIRNFSRTDSIRYNSYYDRVYRKNRLSNRVFSNVYQSNVTVRITLSEEIDESGYSKNEIVDNPDVIRVKRRYTTEYKGCTLFLTHVEGKSEIEIEMKDRNPELFEEAIQDMVNRIVELQNVMTYYKNMMSPNTRHNPLTTRFLGSMPISYRKAYNLRRYSLKYKFDGERVNLILFNRRLYLMTRENGLIFSPVRLNDNQNGSELSGIYDAEIIKSKSNQICFPSETCPSSKEHYLILYDLMVDQEENIMKSPYYRRYRRLTQVMPVLSENIPNIIRSPLMSTESSRIIERRVLNRSVSFRLSGNVITFMIDGLILQDLDSPYITGTDHRLYKWKDQNDITVDFIPVRPRQDTDDSRNEIHLYSEVLDGDMMVTKSRLSDNPSPDLTIALDNRIVSEFYYDRDRSTWIFNRLREDKNKPNFITTVLDVMESALSYVDISELLEIIQKDNE